MSSIGLSLIAFVVIMTGVYLGVLLRRALPDDHLADETKDVIRLGTGLVGTIAALVLGLLIASAKNVYDTQSSQIRQATAYIVLLDQVLAHYGPQTRPARELLRAAASQMAERIWQENGAQMPKDAPFEATAAGEAGFAKILELAPQNDVQTALKARAIQISADLAHTRLLLFEQAESSIPMPFLAVLVFWLTIIFASFSLFSRLNTTLIAALFVFALSASAAIFLILEMSRPFSGLMQVSRTGMLNALAPLGP